MPTSSAPCRTCATRSPQIRPGFPREVKDPLILRGDFDNAQPVVGLAVTSDTRSLRELSTMTDQIIVKRFQNVTGVGQVQVFGGRTRQIAGEPEARADGRRNRSAWTR